MSILNLNEVIKNTQSFRADSEYYQKLYLHEDNVIAKHGFQRLKNITNKIDVGYVGSMVEHYREEGVFLLQTKNINSFFINENSNVYITEKFHNNLSKSQVNYEDILIARSGSFGKASIYLEKEIINSSDIILLSANKSMVNPYFLVSFLNSRFGVNQMIRFASGGLQGHVNLTILEELQVPKMDEEFEKEVEIIILNSYSKKKLSQQKYAEAEKLLLETLGLQDFQPSAESVNIKSFKESFVTTGRLDAEYYQPKYEETVNRIKQNDWKLLNQIVNISKSIEPGSSAYDEEKGLPFYRVSDYNKFGLNTPAKNLSLSYVKENKDLLNDLKPKAGTILFSKDGSVGTAYLLTQDLNGITSGATLHLKVKEEVNVLPEYLTLALNSKLVQLQAERDAGGSIILHWRLDEIENVVVPIVNFPIQQQIATLIQESFALKAESERLLEVAKRSVEIAIEENEEVALDYINENS